MPLLVIFCITPSKPLVSILICRSCDSYDELENRCRECGCYVPGKARIILDSCPLNKWGVDSSNWEQKFSEIEKDMGLDNTPESE